MNADTIKAENKAFTVATLRNAFRMRNTRSGALRLAGIKETKSASALKKSKNSKKKRLNKKKRNAFNNYFSEEYMSDGVLRPKKLRKPLKQYVPRKPRYKKNNITEAPELPQNDLEKNDEKTIFVSLDFIEDCQNYKKKVRKTKESSFAMREQKSRSPNSSQEGLEKKKSQKLALDVKSQWGNLEKGRVSKSTEKKPENDLKETKSKLGKSVLESEDIAKIDKIYLEKLLSLATNPDDQKISSEGESETSESLSKKKVWSGKYFFEKKMRMKELQGNFPKNVHDSSSANGRPKDSSGSQGAAVASPIIVRGKSEEQILLKKGKNLFETQDNVKQKSETHSGTARIDIVEIDRKARKPRNKFMKSNTKEIVDPSLSREVSKVADVKELWRRNVLLNKSDNSLTSLSSCNAPELDEYFESRDLDSYRILKKLVEDEINNIMKKTENKGNAKDETKETDPKPENQKPEDRKKTKDSPLPLPIRMDPEKLNALPLFKRRLLQAECESKLQKAQMLRFLTDDIPKEANPRLEQLEEKEKGGKIPSKVIENWNILHRLEQAFLGLGSPTFPDGNPKISANIKPKTPITKGDVNAALEKIPSDRVREVKRVQQLPGKRENKSSGNQISSHQTLKTRTPFRSVKKALSCDNRPQEQQPGAKKLGKTTRQEYPQTSLATPPKREEVKKKKLKTPPDALLPKTSSRNPPELASRNTKKELGSPNPDLFTPSKSRLVQIRSKPQKLTKKKSSHAVSMNSNQKKKSEENLERKKTFNVISVTDASIDRLHKSNSLNDVNLKGQKSSQTKNRDKTPSDVVSDVMKREQKLKSKTIESDAIAKGKSNIPKRLAKYQPTAARSEQTSEECKSDEKMLGRIRNVAGKLRHSGEKKHSTLSGTDETKISGEKDSPNLKTANERASSKRSAVREKTLPNLKTISEKESSNPKKGSHQQESSEVEIVCEKELRKPETTDEKDSPSSKTAGEKVSPNLKTIDEKAFPSNLTVIEKSSSLTTVGKMISSIKVADENVSSESGSSNLKMVDEMLSPSPRISGENYSSNFKLIDEMVSPSPTTVELLPYNATVEKDSSKSMTVEEKNATLKIVGEKIFLSTKVDDEKVSSEKGSSSLKMVDEMITPSPKVGGEKDSSNPKTADENESPSLKKAGEKDSSGPKTADENESPSLKKAGEKDSSNLKTADENESPSLKIAGEKDSSNLKTADKNEPPSLKKAGEKDSSNPKTTDENESPSLKKAGEKDSSNPKTADENESPSLKKAGEKHSSILNITGEKNSSEIKVVDEKNPLKPMVGEKGSSHINILDQKDSSKHMIPDAKVSSLPKVDVEKDSSNPNLVDKRLSAELNVPDGNDAFSFKIVNEKLCSRKSELQLSKGSVLPYEATEKEAIVKELSNKTVKAQQTEYKSNDCVNVKIDEKTSNCNTHISYTNANAIKQRVVKKRSFLSVHVNQTCDQPPRVLVRIKEKDSVVKIGKNVFSCSTNKESESNLSQVSTLTYNLNDLDICDYFNSRSSQSPGFRPPTDNSTRSSMSMSRNSFSLDESFEQEENSREPSKKQLWEKDLTHYRSIVRDIMNQYKRIDGFLKQNEHLIDSPNEVSTEEVNTREEGSLNSQMNIKEYRKKIMSAYKELPVLEYRTKQLQSGNSFSPNSRRTSLLVAKEVERGADLDVKDYVPNVQKVLDSQLYVDMERLVKRNEANVNPKQKNSSLQDMKSEKRTDPNENSQKGSSSAKAFQVWLNSTNYSGSQTLSCDQITESATNDSYSDSDFS